MNLRNRRAVEILLVEDNPGDVRLTREALRDAKVHNRLTVAADGIEALAYLRGETPHAGIAPPDLILLDLNLPRMNGFEVLDSIKQDEQLRSIPVVILTTSQAEQDILHGYSLHANAYVTKPVDLEQFMSLIRAVEGFWLEIVKLPTRKY